MAWSTPRPWAVNEVLTAANMNTFVSDELSWLGGNTDFPVKSRPHCRVQDATRTHAAGSSGNWVDVAFDSAPTDIGPTAMWTDGASYVTIPAAGFWLISAWAQWTTNDGTGVRGIALSSSAVSVSNVPGGTIHAMATAPGSSNANAKVSVHTSTMVQLASLAKVYCSIFQSSGNALTVAPIVLSAVYVMS